MYAYVINLLEEIVTKKLISFNPLKIRYKSGLTVNPWNIAMRGLIDMISLALLRFDGSSETSRKYRILKRKSCKVYYSQMLTIPSDPNVNFMHC